MKTSILICATCLVVTGCSAQLRFPSLSSALSSLTGFGGSNSGSSSSQSGQSSPYSGLVRDYGRNLMMAMSSIYPTLFKPPQQQQQSQPAPQSPFEQFSAGQHAGSQNLFSSQSAPTLSFGGSTYSFSPSLPFGSLSGASQQQQQQHQPSPQSGGSHSPFGASFGSSINSPSSFGPLSSAPFLSQSMPSFAPASSYNAAFEAANGGPSSMVGSPSFQGLGSAGPSSMHSSGPSSLSGAQMIPQSSQPSPINSYSSIPNYASQHDSNGPLMGASSHQSAQAAQLSQQPGLGGPHSSMNPFGSGPQQNQASGSQQYSSQQYRPEMMSIAASAPVPSSNSYQNYGSISSGPSQQAPASSSSYQQPSYR